MNSNQPTRFTGILFLLLCAFVSAFYGCVSPKQIVYFQSADTSQVTNLPQLKPVVTRIQSSDILAITVGSFNQESNEILNFANINALTTTSFPNTQAAMRGQPLGYLVDSSGHVEIPFVGRVKVIGLTLDQAGNLVRAEVGKSLKEPAVNVRFLNHKFSLLGEVNRPGTYNLLDDHTTLPEALAMAGDLTIYGQRTNVMLIRETENGRTMTRINLLSREIFASPNYYLRNGDVIYVEPSKAKATYTDRSVQLVPIITSVATAIVVFLNVILK
ncbi:polysaccharide biosynthesis/export family protein [Runella limosa]|uniref:polysaccharide biosynthesis/export family protein n=1 Tax=Runella limosa TaxID=370978 RepID=UPI000401B326|nr:polysaccharide biosynthesis/export family protein [Runella limosa]